MKKLTVLKVNVNEEPEVVTIENTNEAMNEIVGGWLQTVMVAEDILLVVNEEGLLHDLPVNFQTIVVENNNVRPVHTIHGNVFFVSMLGEDFHSLDKLQIQRVKKMFVVARELCVVAIR